MEDQSWDIYQLSQWYKEQEGTPGKLTALFVDFALLNVYYLRTGFMVFVLNRILLAGQ